MTFMLSKTLEDTIGPRHPLSLHECLSELMKSDQMRHQLYMFKTEHTDFQTALNLCKRKTLLNHL